MQMLFGKILVPLIYNNNMLFLFTYPKLSCKISMIDYIPFFFFVISITICRQTGPTKHIILIRKYSLKGTISVAYSLSKSNYS